MEQSAKKDEHIKILEDELVKCVLNLYKSMYNIFAF